MYLLLLLLLLFSLPQCWCLSFMFCLAKFSSVDCHSVVWVTVGQIWFQVNFDLAYNHGQQSWDTFAFLGHFPIHRSNPSLHLTKNVGRVYPEFFPKFQLCIGWGERELQENFEKDALFYEGTEKWQKNMNIALLSQGLLSMIVGWLSVSNVS